VNVNCVQVVNLRDDEPIGRQILAYTAHLPEGTRVRVLVGSIPAWSITHTDWYRDDLVLQVESDQPGVLIGWSQRLNELENHRG
jgi:hypothetical protein